MSTQYFPIEIDLTEGQQKKVQSSIKNSQECTVRINPSVKGRSKLFVTQTQLNKLANAKKDKKSIDIKFSKEQLKHQTGGFLPLLGVLAASVLPFLGKAALAGAAGTAASHVVNKIAGGGTKIIGKKYNGDGIRVLGKKYGNGSKNSKKRG